MQSNSIIGETSFKTIIFAVIYVVYGALMENYVSSEPALFAFYGFAMGVVYFRSILGQHTKG